MNTTLFSPQVAEQRLHEALGERPGYWSRFLANNRRADRSPAFRIPIETVSGRPFYPATGIEAFIEHERAKRVQRHGLTGRASEVMAAFGIGDGGSSTGRPFAAQITSQIDEGTSGGFVQVITANPFAVYRLEVDQAREVASQLLKEATAAAQEAARSGVAQ